MTKHTIVIAIAVLSSIAVPAQDMYDALKYSETNYYGTARTIAIGNAVTALGGDLGTITINPAGAAVNSYSQFTISPGLSISSVGASYSPVAYSDQFTSSSTTGRTVFTVPNFGFVLNMEGSGVLKNQSLGFVINTSNRYNDRMSVSGTNYDTSMMGAMAYSANGISYNLLDDSQAYYNNNLAWSDVLAYKSYMIGEYADYTDQYLGTTEKEYADGGIGIMGPLKQNYSRLHSGRRNDIVFNYAANFNDRLYLGINLGIPVLSYTEKLYQYEAPVDPSEFAVTFSGQQSILQDACQGYYLSTEATGLYARLGAIYRLGNLRFGAAIQTPTWYVVDERWGWEAETNFDNFSAYDSTPEGEYSYNFTTPFIADLGVAWTIGGRAFISADWEMLNNRSMRFRTIDYDYGYYDEYGEVNNIISEYAGKTYELRLGAEYKIFDCIALRAGLTGKEVMTSDESGAEYYDMTASWSCGLGYSSPDSFFCDVALKCTSYPESWYYPYDNYCYDNVGQLTVASPEIYMEKTLYDLVFTFGWRF